METRTVKTKTQNSEANSKNGMILLTEILYENMGQFIEDGVSISDNSRLRIYSHTNTASGSTEDAVKITQPEYPVFNRCQWYFVIGSDLTEPANTDST